ncbi:hypothetical protein DSO57_1033157 [Entomophthora muscae]|uniref:Uncharacterized protein n=1 Tax=Entomophthora muscae TaxID=34485 RepID=A0ACC2T0E4_9FUNG|nr:hypothetical protein DSO57_1033157 [Entomophthora muscae]
MPPKKNSVVPNTSAPKQSFFTKGAGGKLEISIPETPRVGRLMEKTEEHEKLSRTIDEANLFNSSENSCPDDTEEITPIIKKRVKVSHAFLSSEDEFDADLPSLPHLTQSTSVNLTLEADTLEKPEPISPFEFDVQPELISTSPVKTVKGGSLPSSPGDLDLSIIEINDSPTVLFDASRY